MEDAKEDAKSALKSVLSHGCNTCRTECDTTAVPDVKVGDAVIARTERGIEYALVLTEPTAFGPNESRMPAEVLRRATDTDTQKHETNEAASRGSEFDYCRERIKSHQLPMKLVKVEKLFGGGRITFHFLSETRIDFRDLVRDLAREFNMRVELKQIGARDEAKILGDVSYCGRELCCSSWIREMRPVSMKMAKNQKATLDPSKISGVCGRLLCCLRYEDEVYTELRKELPKRGKRIRVESTGQTGMVLHQEVLAQSCLILLDRGGTATIPGNDIQLETA